MIRNKLKDGTFRDFLIDWQHIFGYTKRYKGYVAVQIIFGILSTTLALVTAVISKYAIDIVISGDSSSLPLLIVIMLSSALIGILFSGLQNRVSAKISLRVNNDIRAEIFDKIMNAEWQKVNKFPSGDLISRMNEDTSAVAGIAISWLPSAIVTLYAFVSSLIAILFYDRIMAMIALLSAPFLLLTGRGLMKKSRMYHKKMLEKRSALTSCETEALYSLDTLKSLGITSVGSERFRASQNEYKDSSLASNLFGIKANALLSGVSYLVSFAAFGYCLRALWLGQISYGTMSFFLQQRSRLTYGFSSFVSLIPEIFNSAVSARRLQEISDMPQEIHDKTDFLELESYAGKGVTVRLRQVDFEYEKDKPVLHESSFIAAPNEIIAIIGSSGEGKTTLIRLMLGLIRPEHGNAELIFSDGTVQTITADHRALFSVVPQGNTIMSGTIRENLLCVRPNSTDAELWYALDTACAKEFVERMKGGLDAVLGERGHGLSEGQAQRLAIARAVLRDAPILLLDEATSALDLDTERRIISNLIKQSQNKTCIVSTHRESVLSLCDRVYAVQDGTLKLILKK